MQSNKLQGNKAIVPDDGISGDTFRVVIIQSTRSSNNEHLELPFFVDRYLTSEEVSAISLEKGGHTSRAHRKLAESLGLMDPKSGKTLKESLLLQGKIKLLIKQRNFDEALKGIRNLNHTAAKKTLMNKLEKEKIL